MLIENFFHVPQGEIQYPENVFASILTDYASARFSGFNHPLATETFGRWPIISVCDLLGNDIAVRAVLVVGFAEYSKLFQSG